MRLWSIHPSYLDQKGLCGLWREALLAQRVLLKGEYTECPRCEGVGWGLIDKAKDNVGYNDCPKCKGKGKIKTPYYNHSALLRFKQNKDMSIYWITSYLYVILEEGLKRGYKFDKNKIRLAKQKSVCLTVTKGQLVFEIHHLLKKLKIRDRKQYIKVSNKIEWREGANHLYYNENKIKTNPIFKIVNGDKEQWERG